MKVPPAKVFIPPEDRALILARIDEALASGQLTLGRYGREFEEQFARYVGTRYAVAVNSGTSAIEIVLRAINVTGREVIVPTNTFFATPAAVLHAGGVVRFIDADPATFSVRADDVARAITDRTAGVIVVHIGGIVTPEMPAIRRVCQERGVFLLEDAAHAHGSSLDGTMAGAFGSAATFSFYPTKVITAGEGGMIVTNSEPLRDAAYGYRDQGKVSFTVNQHDKLGNNWRMSELHAIVGLSQFTRLEEFIAVRRRTAAVYDARLPAIGGVTPLIVPPACRSNYYKYIALLDDGIDRATLKRTLRERYDIGLSGEVYELPCHLQPIFRERKWKMENGKQEMENGKWEIGEFPIAEDLCRRHICLPISAVMTDEEAHTVLGALERGVREG